MEDPWPRGPGRGGFAGTVLPTKMQLRQHHVHCPATRDLCSGAVEDTWHVLFDCEGTKNCWMAAGLQTVIAARLQEYDNARDVIFYICHRESKEIAGTSK
jgi:hypothetical protein